MKKLCDLPSGSVVILPTYRIVGPFIVSKEEFVLKDRAERRDGLMVLYRNDGNAQSFAQPKMLVELKGHKDDKAN